MKPSRNKRLSGPTLKVALGAPTRGGSPLELAVPDQPLGLAAFVSVAREYGEKRLRQAVAREVQGSRTVSCRAGCAACCRQLVPVSGAEALRLAGAYRALDRQRQKSLQTRIDTTVDLLLASPVAPAVRALVMGELQPGDIPALARAYFELNLTCPLLVDDRCQLYDHRPLACMDHLVTSPPELCALAGRGLTERIETGPPLTWPLVHLVADLTGERPELLPLPFALGWAEVHKELGQRSFPARSLLDGFFGAFAMPERPAG